MAFASATPETLLVLDNDLFTHWRNSHEYVRLGLDRYLSRHKRLPALASIVVFEALKGFQRDQKGQVDSRLAEKFDRLQELVRSTDVLSFDLRAAELAAVIFPGLTRKQQRRNDVFIAATALANQCGVATRNRKDFEAIGSLLPASFGHLYIDVWR
jgi:predicted nucleic acid-binding protein